VKNGQIKFVILKENLQLTTYFHEVINSDELQSVNSNLSQLLLINSWILVLTQHLCH